MMVIQRHVYDLIGKVVRIFLRILKPFKDTLAIRSHGLYPLLGTLPENTSFIIDI